MALRITKFLCGMIFAAAILLILLITSIEIAAYANWDYYKSEYEKLQVLDQVDMTMEDLMDVTKEMMAYLRGNRENLIVETNIDGTVKDFFNDRERAHMADVQKLFIGGLNLRRGAILAAVVILAVMKLLKVRLKEFISGHLIRGILAVSAAAAVLAGLFAADFTKYFTRFHEIFFDNDLWLLNPAEDRLINIVPEPFWVHIAVRVVLIFAGMMAVLLLVLICGRIFHKKKQLGALAMAFMMTLCMVMMPAQPVSAMESSSAAETSSEAESGSALTGLAGAPAENPVSNPKGLTDLTSLADESKQPEVQSEYAILIEARTGAILYKKNSDERAYPASITKVLTALMVMEQCQLTDQVTFSYRATHEVERGSSSIARTEGEVMSVEDCLYGLLVASANEVAQAFAEHMSGSLEQFAEDMNLRAKQLGAEDTNFTNPSGLHNENHYTTAHDMALFMQAAMKYSELRKIMGTTAYTIPSTNKHKDSLPISVNNPILRDGPYKYEGAIASKTGFTDQALCTLVTYAERGDVQLVCVVMKAPSTQQVVTDTEALFDYGFQNFSSYNMVYVNGGSEAGQLKKDYLEGNLLSYENGEESWITLPKSAVLDDLDCEVSYTEDASQGSTAVTRIYKYNGLEVGRIPVKVLAPEPAVVLPRETRMIDGFDAFMQKRFLGMTPIGWLILVVVLTAVITWLRIREKQRIRRNRQLREQRRRKNG